MERLAEKHSQSSPLFFACFGFAGLDGCDFFSGIFRTAYVSKYQARLLGLFFHRQPSRTLRNEESQQKEKSRGESRAPEHPAPPHQYVPGIGGWHRGPCRHRFRNQKIDNLSPQYAKHYGELIERDKFSADIGKGQLGDIHRRQPGSDTDSDSSDETDHQKTGETVERSRTVGGHKEDESRSKQKRLAAEPVGQRTRYHRAGKTSGQGDTHSQALLFG